MVTNDFTWAEVGERIRRRRTAESLTQTELANAAGLTQIGVFKLEAGATNPQLKTLRSIAAALKCSIRDLIYGMREDDARLRQRLGLLRRILESGDEAATRALDNGLGTACDLLERRDNRKRSAPAELDVKTEREFLQDLFFEERS